MTKRKHVNALFTFNKNVSQELTDALAFYLAISTAPGNAWVTIAPALISAAQGRVASARAAETAVATGAIGLASARDLAVGLVEADVRNFVMTVQAAANNALDVATAKTIVTECGLTTKKISSKTKAAFDVVLNGTTAGLLDIIFKAANSANRSCYETHMSTDNVTWTSIKVTPDSKTSYMHGMAPVTKLYFRGRVILGEKKGGAQAWLIPHSVYIVTL